MNVPAYLADIQAGVDSWWPYLQAQQAAFLALHGYYFQGLPTHSEPPSDGTFVAPDELTQRPSDQPQDWQDVPGGFPLAETTASLRCDVYQSAGGWGYVATFDVRDTSSGVRYRCTRHVGPESRREHDFEAMDDSGRLKTGGE
jgi:hypothetical protein